MIHLSKAAVREVNRLKSKQPNSQVFFRLGVQAGGCAGLSYTMEFDENAGEGDHVYGCEGIQVLVHAESLNYLNGVTLDYSEDLMGGGFRFHNPNALQACSCGHSFSVPASAS